MNNELFYLYAPIYVAYGIYCVFATKKFKPHHISVDRYTFSNTINDPVIKKQHLLNMLLFTNTIWAILGLYTPEKWLFVAMLCISLLSMGLVVYKSLANGKTFTGKTVMHTAIIKPIMYTNYIVKIGLVLLVLYKHLNLQWV